VPEVVDEGVTGFVVEDEMGAVGAVDRLSQLSRERIRERFEERFTARRMALEYPATYRGLIEGASLRLRLVVDEGPSLRVAGEGH
jgi:glycosyltransferase involved in cell wall biosynthesis